jgi:hypothetical protein
LNSFLILSVLITRKTVENICIVCTGRPGPANRLDLEMGFVPIHCKCTSKITNLVAPPAKRQCEPKEVTIILVN